MKKLLYLLIISAQINLSAQNIIKGRVEDHEGIPLTGANVYIQGSYEGTISDTAGFFVLDYKAGDSDILVVSYIGFETYKEKLAQNQDQIFRKIILHENARLEEVVITAGMFEAGEKSRAVLLNPIEIATTASSNGDVFGALSFFPGVQKQGESGEIIVRGGDASESKTYMDGMLVSSPYSSTMPDLPARGRFSPFMFNGVMFSTGGYSAEYGQALSSVLELKTPGLFDESLTSVGIMNVGASLGHTERNSRSAYSTEINYNNLYPYFLMAKHELDWIKVPQSLGANFYYRVKTGKTGFLKTDIVYNNSSSKLDYSNFESTINKIGLKNQNLFIKSNYSQELGDNWMIKAGIAGNVDSDKKELDLDKLSENLFTLHSRFGIAGFINKSLTFKTGGEVYMLSYKFKYSDFENNESYPMEVQDLLYSGYLEGDIKMTKNIALRVGGRAEHTTYTSESKVSPRVSMAYKTRDKSQFSFAWGKYYQQAQPEYLKYTSDLTFENAEHFILNYQIVSENRVFRAETYYKTYNNLITYDPGVYEEFENISNTGDGYAKGIDLFWKDSETFKNMNYWISYSFVDSKRKYKNYPYAVTPEFVARHNLSLVLKYWIETIQTQACLTYNYTSGRPYNNPNLPDYMSDKTKSIHDLSGNLSYITNIFGYFTVVHLSVSNIFGLDKIYSYRYSSVPDDQGIYHASPIKSMMQRSIILGVFISIK
ncbi:MAG: TonB-dependent receptor [Bacteroidales bacterium]|nr:TonB-dependent receptor [Bacteroidales bacterium]